MYLLVLSAEENSPRDSARVLALQEQRLGLAALESENTAVATAVQLALAYTIYKVNAYSSLFRCLLEPIQPRAGGEIYRGRCGRR